MGSEIQVTVIVVALGIQKEGSKQDIYILTKKLLTLGLPDELERDQKDDQSKES